MWELLLPNQKIDQPLGVVLVWPGATQLQPCNPGEIDLELLYWALTCGRCRCPFQLLSLLRCAFFFFFFARMHKLKVKKIKILQHVRTGKGIINSDEDLEQSGFLMIDVSCVLNDIRFCWGGGGGAIFNLRHTHTHCVGVNLCLAWGVALIIGVTCVNGCRWTSTAKTDISPTCPPDTYEMWRISSLLGIKTNNTWVGKQFTVDFNSINCVKKDVFLKEWHKEAGTLQAGIKKWWRSLRKMRTVTEKLILPCPTLKTKAKKQLKKKLITKITRILLLKFVGSVKKICLVKNAIIEKYKIKENESITINYL